MMKKIPGILYIVATPMGNLGDMTVRAIEILKTVDCIAAEDTRHSKPLLQHFLISTPLMALHEHNEREKSAYFIERLQQGESIAIISDAGTPLISDPGYFIVREARRAGIQVVPIPGACAAITALSAAGFPTDRFSFEGFLPAKEQARCQRLESLRQDARTLVFYESPHRVLDCLQNMETVFGSAREAVVARELTKMFETIQHGKLAELVEWMKQDKNQQRGEFVLIVAGFEKDEQMDDDTSVDDMLKILLEELPLKQAADLAARISGRRKNDLYQRALKWKG